MFEKFPYRGQTPLKESYSRIHEEYAKNLFYYHQVDLLHELSAGKAWSWCEVRPDIIVSCTCSAVIINHANFLKS